VTVAYRSRNEEAAKVHLSHAYESSAEKGRLLGDTGGLQCGGGPSVSSPALHTPICRTASAMARRLLFPDGTI